MTKNMMIPKRQFAFKTLKFLSKGIVPIFVLLIGGSVSVFACSCAKASPCERFNYSNAIFIGKAVRVEPGQSGSLKTESTIFEVKEVFSGEKTGSIRVKNKFGFSCDVEFKVGETYLIFAGGNKTEGYGTGGCSGNLPIEYAGTEITELRKLSGSKGDGKLLGTVLEEFGKRAKDEDERLPIKGVRMEITDASTGRKFFTSTNANGRYALVVPPGKYAVSPVVPANAIMPSTFIAEPVEIRSGGCAEGYFVFSNSSVIAGRLLDDLGKPVPNARVELVSVDEKASYLSGLSDETDVNGNFSIEQIPAGKYTLSINYSSNPEPDRPFPTTFYPRGSERSLAKAFEVGSGTRTEGLTWRLPPRLVEKEVTGKVVLEDGSPAIGAEIKLFDMAFPGFYAGCYLIARTVMEETNSPVVVSSTSVSQTGSTCNLKSDENGVFRLRSYSGRSYRLEASLTPATDGQKIEFTGVSEPFSLNGDMENITLVLRKK